jgi:hypothetical protein
MMILLLMIIWYIFGFFGAMYCFRKFNNGPLPVFVNMGLIMLGPISFVIGFFL